MDIFKDETYYELYDIYSDPEEKDNLIFTSSSDELMMSMHSSLVRHMKECGDMITLKEPDPDGFRTAYASIGSEANTFYN